VKKMSFVAGTLLCTPVFAQLPSAADPSITLPPVAYRSVFASTPAGMEMQASDWKEANAQVGQFRRGHADVLKWEQAQRPTTQPNASKR